MLSKLKLTWVTPYKYVPVFLVANYPLAMAIWQQAFALMTALQICCAVGVRPSKCWRIWLGLAVTTRACSVELEEGGRGEKSLSGSEASSLRWDGTPVAQVQEGTTTIPRSTPGQSPDPRELKGWKLELYKLWEWFHRTASFFTRSATVRILKSHDLHLCTILNFWQMYNFSNWRARNRKLPKIF